MIRRTRKKGSSSSCRCKNKKPMSLFSFLKQSYKSLYHLRLACTLHTSQIHQQLLTTTTQSDMIGDNPKCTFLLCVQMVLLHSIINEILFSCYICFKRFIEKRC